MKLFNAFSLNMVQHSEFKLEFREASLDEAKTVLTRPFESFVGHPDTAAVLSSLLGVDVPFNRQSVVLEMGEAFIVAQYSGARLPEGCKTLPEGAAFKFLLGRLQ
jgi:hypothetical protein